MDVEVIAINYPNFLTRELVKELPTQEKREIVEASSQKLMGIIEENCPDAIIYRPRSGDKFYMPECEIEIIFTHEDVADVELGWMNDTSTAFRITLGGHTAMIYADCERISGDYIYEKYGSALKSDIMQVPHHGAGMSSWELYSATDPEICLWEVSEYKFENDARMLGYKVETAEGGAVTITDEPNSRFFNAQLRDDSIRARRHYSLSYTTVIDMETLEVQTYRTEKTPAQEG
jgi:beta-lactamase superfamily II metal-dependent hydrolase